MCTTNTEIKLIISKSMLLNNDNYDEIQLEEKMVIFEKEINLNRKDIYDLIINENINKLFDNFGIVWTFINKYDFNNIETLKQKYEKYCCNEKIKIQNKANNEKEEINIKINELNGNILLKYLGVQWIGNKSKLVIEKGMIDKIKIVEQKIKDLVDIVCINFIPNNDNEIKGLPLTHLDLSKNKNITNEGIKGMCLTQLNLDSNDMITNEGIKGMSLTQLNLSHNKKITDEGIKGMPLTQLNLTVNDMITDEGIKGMLLIKLNLCWNNMITNEGIQGMLLTYLDLYKNNMITNEGIKGMPLTYLDLSYNNMITDEGITGVPLTHLCLFKNENITDAGIKGMPLAELNLLGNKKITDEEIKELKEKGCVIIKTNQ